MNREELVVKRERELISDIEKLAKALSQKFSDIVPNLEFCVRIKQNGAVRTYPWRKFVDTGKK